jgi:hypothetical protein
MLFPPIKNRGLRPDLLYYKSSILTIRYGNSFERLKYLWFKPSIPHSNQKSEPKKMSEVYPGSVYFIRRPGSFAGKIVCGGMLAVIELNINVSKECDQ